MLSFNVLNINIMSFIILIFCHLLY